MKTDSRPSVLSPLPRGPWSASQQYGSLHFVLSKDNEIILKCSHLPFGMVKAITAAANVWMEQNPTNQPAIGEGN
jgi:hypothetical protein